MVMIQMMIKKTMVETVVDETIVSNKEIIIQQQEYLCII
jgi:hypothetical protein